MKKRMYVLGLSVALICGACNDWLTIQPETTVSAETLMETDDGIKQSLNGVYYNASGSFYKPSGYMGGGDFLEDMANTYYYNPVNGGFGYYWANHIFDYNATDQDNVTQATFVNAYNNIANLNSLISEMAKNCLLYTSDAADE